MNRVFLAVAALTLAIAAGPTVAADTSAGASLAHMVCASCHDVSPMKPRRAEIRTPAVPPAFYAIAQDPAHTAEWFMRFLRLPHGKMDNVVLTQPDIDNVSAYILAMRDIKP